MPALSVEREPTAAELAATEAEQEPTAAELAAAEAEQEPTAVELAAIEADLVPALLKEFDAFIAEYTADRMRSLTIPTVGDLLDLSLASLDRWGEALS